MAGPARRLASGARAPAGAAARVVAARRHPVDREDAISCRSPGLGSRDHGLVRLGPTRRWWPRPRPLPRRPARRTSSRWRCTGRRRGPATPPGPTARLPSPLLAVARRGRGRPRRWRAASWRATTRPRRTTPRIWASAPGRGRRATSVRATRTPPGSSRTAWRSRGSRTSSSRTSSRRSRCRSSTRRGTAARRAGARVGRTASRVDGGINHFRR